VYERLQKKQGGKPTIVTTPLKKTYQMNTYKMHALGHYAPHAIRYWGTTDGNSGQGVSFFFFAAILVLNLNRESLITAIQSDIIGEETETIIHTLGKLQSKNGVIESTEGTKIDETQPKLCSNQRKQRS
jgi:hypothetical protein